MIKAIKITLLFASTHNNNVSGRNIFTYFMDISGNYYCNYNSVITHPGLFEGQQLDIVYVSLDNVVENIL